MYLFAADVTLEQTAGPTASGVGGELASAPTVAGTRDVAFSASDPGAGVYEAQFVVDGQVVQRTVLDENGGRCRDVGQATDGLPAFLYMQPCLASLSVDVGLDTTKIANGAHKLVVEVLDAAGNQAPVLDRQIIVANPVAPGTPGPANGINASAGATLAVRWSRTKRASLTIGYAQPSSVSGRLTAPGALPIAGAQVEVLSLASYAGAKPALIGRPRTAPDGSFALRLSAHMPSSDVRFIYSAHVGDAVPAVTRTLRLNVRAGLKLHIVPRTASVGRSIWFTGRLVGGPVPRDGKQLILEARSPGGPWIEFKVVRSDARGRYRAAYRFKFPGPATYQFRVRSEVESDYPFAAGSSPALSVRER